MRSTCMLAVARSGWKKRAASVVFQRIVSGPVTAEARQHPHRFSKVVSGYVHPQANTTIGAMVDAVHDEAKVLLHSTAARPTIL